jgi:hypothetical protein
LTDEDGKQTDEPIASICFEGQHDDALVSSIYRVGELIKFRIPGMIFSLPFLFITFCVYSFFGELRNLHGKSLMCFVLGLMIMYTFLIIVQFEKETEAGDLMCIFCGYMIYIGVLLSFFWMNVMCYDIWSTFRFD